MTGSITLAAISRHVDSLEALTELDMLAQASPEAISNLLARLARIQDAIKYRCPPMIWTLIYQPPPSAPINTITTIDDWVVPPNWEPSAIVADFEERFPGSTVISLLPSEAAT